MNEENVELNKEMEGLKKNLKVLQINADTLVYEDETRSKELEVGDLNPDMIFPQIQIR